MDRQLRRRLSSTSEASGGWRGLSPPPVVNEREDDDGTSQSSEAPDDVRDDGHALPLPMPVPAGWKGRAGGARLLSMARPLLMFILLYGLLIPNTWVINDAVLQPVSWLAQSAFYIVQLDIRSNGWQVPSWFSNANSDAGLMTLLRLWRIISPSTCPVDAYEGLRLDGTCSVSGSCRPPQRARASLSHSPAALSAIWPLHTCLQSQLTHVRSVDSLVCVSRDRTDALATMILPTAWSIICCAQRGTAIAGMLYGSFARANFCIQSSMLGTAPFFRMSMHYVVDDCTCVPSASPTGARARARTGRRGGSRGGESSTERRQCVTSRGQQLCACGASDPDVQVSGSVSAPSNGLVRAGSGICGCVAQRTGISGRDGPLRSPP